MNKNLIYIININNPESKINHQEYSQYCIKSWEYWCKKNNTDLHVVEHNDPRCGKSVWNKELIFERGQNYEKIGVVDADTMIKWDSPNIFETFNEEFCMVKDDINLNWVHDSISNRKKFFPNLDLSIDEYGNAGVIFFHTKYLNVFKEVFDFYQKNKLELDNWNKGGGTEQTIFNFILKQLHIPVTYISPKWNLLGMHKKGWFQHNFQLGDNTPHFIKHGNIWHFTGFAIEQRINVVKQTWDLIKKYYN
jgi:hypothetical protein